MEQPKKRKELSPGAKEILHNEAKKICEEEINYLNENLPKLVAKEYFNLKDRVKTNQINERIELVDLILKKYIPLGKELKKIEKIYFPTNVIKENEVDFISSMMVLKYKSIENKNKKQLTYYDGLNKLYRYIGEIIKLYKKDLEEKLEKLTKENKIKNSPRTEIFIEKEKRKIVILEEYYLKGVSATEIGESSLYENNGRFDRDRRELLTEISEYFNFAIACLDVLS